MTWEKIKKIIGYTYVYGFEKLLFIHWFNPLITLYVNLRSFPLRQAVKFPVFVYGWPRLYSLYGSMECASQCQTGMIKLNLTNATMPCHTGCSTEINNWGKIIFHGKCNIFTHSKIDVKQKGILELGKDAKICIMTNITVFTHVKIGNYTRITHRCQVIDSNNHFVADFNKFRVKNMSSPISIGDYCWICNSTSITAGAIIPNKTIVASNSLVGKDMSSIPEESIIGGIPAKLISSGFRRIENAQFIKEIQQYFMSNPEESFYLFNNTNHSICDAQEE